VWLLLALSLPLPVAAAERSGVSERTVCGWITERVGFAMFRAAAGGPDEDRVQGISGIEKVTHRTRDGRTLGGYKLRAAAPGGAAPRGYVLIGPGNAMLADQIIGPFRFLQRAGFDVYIYDYRGYGLSDGESRLVAMISDYTEIISGLADQGYPRKLLYGMSFGGVVMLNAIAAGAPFDAAVIDSTPSRVSGYGCPERLDPVNNLSDDASNLAFIAGRRDRVVPPEDSSALREAGRARGARLIWDDQFAHPFQDRDPAIHAKRLGIVRDLLLGPER
jgi:alpha-beta hydrolase superfamily lysophospholipase